MNKKLSELCCAGMLLAGAGIFSGCASYSEKSADMRSAWIQGNFAHAEKITAEEAESASEEDRLLWQLEHASVLRGMQKNEEAQHALEEAAKTLEAWDEKAEILLSKEAAATLSNLSALPYRGRGLDRIMLHTYRSLNFLEAGKIDATRVALNAAFQAQSEAVERNAKSIEAAQTTATENDVDLADLKKNQSVANAIEIGKSGLSGFSAYADYVNPFTTWLHGIYFLHAGTDASDRERARKSLVRVAQMEPENTFVYEDIKLAEKAVPEDDAITYVIFEYGVAPTLSLVRADLFLAIPTGTGSSTIAPVCIALPKLSREHSAGLPVMRANDVPAQTVCDMNRAVKTDFENAYPVVLARTLTTAFLKTAASVIANTAAQEYALRDGSAAASLIALGTMIGTSVATYATTDADLRTWQTLPEYFSVARIPTPKSRCVTVEIAGHRTTTKLLPGKVNVVVVKSVGFALEPRVNQFILK